MKKTIIQELIDEIVEHLTYDDDLSDDSRMTLETIRLRCLGKLAVEKEQIIDAHTEGYVIGGGNGDLYNCKQYYNETYESKGSDAKDVVLGYKTSLDAQMLDKIKLKQETLEESAEKYANELPEPYNYGINSDKKKGFIEGAKWRQEQILQFLYSEIIERRPYSSSKMCEVVIEFIKQLNTKK
jgi:flagellar biosynthesis/type III secretory pathway protein FliH